LTDGLISFDRQRGWRGPVDKMSTAGDWGAALAAIEVPTDLGTWRLALVLDSQRTKVVVGLRPNRNLDGSVPAERQTVEIPFEEMRWARTARSTPRGSNEVLNVGDVVWAAPKDPAKPTGTWSLQQVPELDGGLVAMDPHTGRVHAVAGGFSFSSQYDRALQARRQPGSVFKPIVYAAALDNGYKPTSLIEDAPIEIDMGRGREPWVPKNYDGGSGSGPTTLRAGIERSRNLMTVRLAQALGMPLVVDYAKRLGAYDELPALPAMSLGSGETTLLNMCVAYAAFDNGGKLVTPTLIDRIQDRWGRSLWRHDSRECRGCKATKWEGQAEPVLVDTRKQVVGEYTAYQMTSIMEGVVQRGTATVIRSILPNVPIAGKTGTTNDERDAWFVGYTPDLVVGVFVGYDTPRNMGGGSTGGKLAAPIFANFMKAALAGKPAVPFRVPQGIKFVRTADGILEAFKPGEEPDEPGAAGAGGLFGGLFRDPG
jgi:penicillin-binding protein 1A